MPWILILLSGLALMGYLDGNFTLNFMKVFQVGYGDIVILGIPGFIWIIIRNRARLLFIGITLSLLVNVFLFIAHFRMRLIYFDWILLMGACVSIHAIMNLISGKKDKKNHSNNNR